MCKFELTQAELVPQQQCETAQQKANVQNLRNTEHSLIPCSSCSLFLCRIRTFIPENCNAHLRAGEAQRRGF